ncbi:MAG: lysine 2,3-aminomutase [Zetaproteobacteria bacterium]|nr:MAG: lysine 2,3-aminomutase [Zetaproteobacteria bacterium]
MLVDGFVQEKPRYRAYTHRHLDAIPQLAGLPRELRHGIRLATQVFPFRVSNYVLDELIDWDAAPDDPLFRLVFPMPEMLHDKALADLDQALANGDQEGMRALVFRIRHGLNPHPAGQLDANIPVHEGRRLHGIQHKYRETVLYFPAQGQTCHSYCSFCFRWPQFVGDRSLRIASSRVSELVDYLRAHPEVSDVLITGGDPLVMQTSRLESILHPLLAPELAHVRTIRIGTKALGYWPQRFVSDEDSDALMRLFERVVASGRQLALMVHVNHPRELGPEIARQAVSRIRATGAMLRSQSPLLRWINDDPRVWARMWREQVRLGIVPYYMFVERDTGAHHYFAIPLARAWEIYRDAYRCVSGLARTVRGPSMSAWPGKVEVQGVAEVNGEKVFVLRMIQGRNPNWVQQPFFARFDEAATWLDELEPAFGQDRFFFQSDC